MDEVAIHPSSVLANSGRPAAAIVFGELQKTSKFYVRDVSAIEQSWLVDIVPNYYTSRMK
jgi:ATP-dependent RNA helicase DDX35